MVSVYEDNTSKGVFQDDSSDSCSLEEECLFRAIQDAEGLAKDL